MEARLFPEGTIPDYTTAAWYEGREVAPHVDQDAHRGRLEIAARFINELSWANEIENIVPFSLSDLGCGDGGLLTLLDRRIDAWGYDLAPANVEAAKTRGVDVRYGDVVNDFESLWLGDIVVMTEFLEHVVDPHQYLRQLADKGVRYIIASSPYLETLESHYEFHAWCWDREGYDALLNQAGYEVTRAETWSIFQVVMGELK